VLPGPMELCSGESAPRKARYGGRGNWIRINTVTPSGFLRHGDPLFSPPRAAWHLGAKSSHVGNSFRLECFGTPGLIQSG
jgi:hypothetical protein